MNQNTLYYIQEDKFGYVVSKVADMLSRRLCVEAQQCHSFRVAESYINYLCLHAQPCVYKVQVECCSMWTTRK